MQISEKERKKRFKIELMQKMQFWGPINCFLHQLFLTDECNKIKHKLLIFPDNRWRPSFMAGSPHLNHKMEASSFKARIEGKNFTIK